MILLTQKLPAINVLADLLLFIKKWILHSNLYRRKDVVDYVASFIMNILIVL